VQQEEVHPRDLGPYAERIHLWCEPVF
jgi:hypothetical protein